MGGDVAMDSTPGQGTTMTLALALEVGNPAEVEVHLAAAVVGGPLRRTLPSREEAQREGSPLLIVEDHPVNRTVLCSQLETIGFRSDTAFDGREGLERSRTGEYALVLTDLNMPNMDGFELARAIREHEERTGGARVPIIALTASVMQGEPERARAAGMDDFAAKPTTIPFLAGRLRAWLADVVWESPAEETPTPDSSGAAPTQAPGAAPAGGVAIDPSVLEQLTGGDAELAAEVLDEFITTTRADLGGLADAIAARKLDDVRRLAHRVKGAARAVGAQPTADVGQQLESLAALGAEEWDCCETLCGELAQALDAVAAAVAARP